MARGKEIVLSSPPRGRFIEGIIYGTPLPGTLMQVKAAVEPVNGRHTWEAAAPSGGDGKPALVAVLDMDAKQGKTASDAYVTGTYGQIYIPAPGDEVNVRVGEGGGTSNTFAIGDELMMDADGGLLVPNSSGTFCPFICLETKTLVADDVLVWCMRSN